MEHLLETLIGLAVIAGAAAIAASEEADTPEVEPALIPIPVKENPPSR